MKWKTALTAEEAALFVTGLSYIGSLAESEELLKGHERFVNSCPLKLRNGEDYTESLEEFKNLEYRLHEAVKINEAIWDEIEHAWLLQERGEGRGSALVLDSWCWNGGVDESLSKLGCKASKESLAEWFYEMDGIDKAKMLCPNFEPHNFSNTKSLKNPTNEFSYDNYPVKLQLAISAYKYFWEEENAGDQRANSDVEAWLHKEAISLKITHTDNGKPMSGISNKVKEVIAQIIKPD